MSIMSSADFHLLLERHHAWLSNESNGEPLILDSVSLKGVDLTGVDLSKIRLSNVDLSNARLEDTDWQGASLQGCIFYNATLRGAKFSEVCDLSVEAFGGCDLQGTRLPAYFPDDFLSAVDKATAYCRTILFMLLLAMAYIMLTVWGTTDHQLVANTANATLPVVHVEVPISGFYGAGALLLLSLLFYFYLYMGHLWEQLGRCPAVLPDGRPLDRAALPWLFAWQVRFYMPQLACRQPYEGWSRLERWAAPLMAGVIPWIAMGMLWWRYLVRHDWPVSLLHVAVLTIGIVLGVDCHERMRRNLARPGADAAKSANRRLLAIGALVLAVGLLCSHGLIHGNKAESATHRFNPVQWAAIRWGWGAADFSEQDVSIKPTHWKWKGQLFEISGANLKGANLRGLRASKAFLVNADFRNADLGGADLSHADLRRTNFSGADLSQANLNGALLVDSVFSAGTKYKDATIKGALLLNLKWRGVGADVARQRFTAAFPGLTIHSVNDDKVAKNILLKWIENKRERGEWGDYFIDEDNF